MQQPLVSIISPTYNHSKYIIDCIKSVQQQSYPAWEMLIINDGSTDNTGVVVTEYIKQSGDNRIKLFNQANIGINRLAETYNFALQQSQGKYIAILEGDDLWEPTKLERQVQIMEQSETVLAWGKAYSVNGDLSETYGLYPTENPEWSEYYDNNPVGSILNVLFFENPITALTILIRKSTLQEIGGFQQGYNLPLVDIPTIMALSLKGNFYFDDFPLGKWRNFPEQATKKYPVEITTGRYKLTLDYLKKVKQENFSSVTAKEENVSNYFSRLIMIAYARAGRYALMRKDFTHARTDYKNALTYKGVSEPMWKLRAFVGYTFSLLHLDVEWLAKLIGRKSYK
jgi:glycosyltransferase involved in cell wall biosynthesis